MNPPLMVVVSVFVAGAPSPTPEAARVGERLRQAGADVATVEVARRYAGQGQEFDVAEVDQELQAWFARVERATDLYYAQRYGKAARAFAEALDLDGLPPLEVAASVRPELPTQWVHASLTAARALQARRQQAKAQQAISEAAARFPEVQVTRAEFPADIVAGFEAARAQADGAGGATGALNVQVRWPAGAQRCQVGVGGRLRGFSPAAIDALPTGQHEVVAVCSAEDGRTVVRSRPLRVGVAARRGEVEIVVGGERQLLDRDGGIGVLGVAGWSLAPAEVELAARAAMARTGAAGAVVVGPDPAAGDGMVALRFGDVGVELGPARPPSAPAGVVGAAGEPGISWLWWGAGGLLAGGAVAGGYAWSAHREFEECKGDPACDPRLPELADRVDGRAVVADALLGAGLIAAGAALLVQSLSEDGP